MRVCLDFWFDYYVYYIIFLDELVYRKKGFFMDCYRMNLYVLFKRLQEVEVENKF